jgi:hypothetical protein
MQLAQERPVVGFCENGNEPSGSIRGGKFLDYLRNYQLLKDSAPWSWSKGTEFKMTYATDVS